jgi:uncharacterized protein (DUF1800 family)
MAPSPHALVAHILRRTTFGPTPDQVAQFADQGDSGPQAALDWALSAAPRPTTPETAGSDDWDPMLRGWTDNIRSPEAGIHEKMTWFWHGHFTTSSLKVGNPKLLVAQQQTLRSNALGSFRDLLRAMTTDPAMLLYLDGSGSSVEAPNENFSREVMELFTLGQGTYTEADVKAGALALAGWETNYETGEVTHNDERGLGGEVMYLGRRGRLGVDEVVDTLCAQESCPPFIVSKLYSYLVGVAPTPERLATLATGFRNSGMQIQPLVNDILHGEDFLQLRLNRPRYPIEWWSAALAALGAVREGEEAAVNPWILEQLDQLPHRPPNVGGWPTGARWLSASQQLARAAYAWGEAWKSQPIQPANGTDLVTATLARCSLFEVSDATRSALADAALATAGAADAQSVSRRLLVTALCSPEFALA